MIYSNKLLLVELSYLVASLSTLSKIIAGATCFESIGVHLVDKTSDVKMKVQMKFFIVFGHFME